MPGRMTLLDQPTPHRKPKRIQRKRTKGYRLPPGAVYVGRPTRWGNPFEVGQTFSPEEAVDAFVVHLSSYFGWRGRAIARAFYPLPVESTEFRDWLAPLRGHDLACWCALAAPCHARHLRP
jgi:hypothetical protein